MKYCLLFTYLEHYSQHNLWLITQSLESGIIHLISFHILGKLILQESILLFKKKSDYVHFIL